MNALAIRNTLKSTGAKAAELQLAQIGSDQGDEQLAIIVGELSAGEVGMLLEEGDYTKPSLVAHFVSPDQLFGALERIGGKWGSLSGSTLNALLSLKREVADFLLPVVLHAEPKHKSELIEALLKESLSRNVLVAVPLFEQGCPQFLKNFDPNLNQHGTWQELYADIHNFDPKAFQRLQSAVLGLFVKKLSDDDEETPTESKQAESFLKRSLQAMADCAAVVVETHPEERKSEEVFKNI